MHVWFFFFFICLHLVWLPVSCWAQWTHPASRARPCALYRKWGCLLPEHKPTPRFPWNCEKEKPCCFPFFFFLYTVRKPVLCELSPPPPHCSQDSPRMLSNNPHIGHKVAGCWIFLSLCKYSLYFLICMSGGSDQAAVCVCVCVCVCVRGAA